MFIFVHPDCEPHENAHPSRVWGANYTTVNEKFHKRKMKIGSGLKHWLHNQMSQSQWLGNVRKEGDVLSPFLTKDAQHQSLDLLFWTHVVAYVNSCELWCLVSTSGLIFEKVVPKEFCIQNNSYFFCWLVRVSLSTTGFKQWILRPYLLKKLDLSYELDHTPANMKLKKNHDNW